MKVGDRVTLSLSCSIELAKYKSLKPHVSITREFSGDTTEETFIAGLDSDLRRQICRQVLLQLDVESDLYAALGDGDVDALVAYCQKELDHVAARKNIEGKQESCGNEAHGVGHHAGSGQSKPPAKKGKVG